MSVQAQPAVAEKRGEAHKVNDFSIVVATVNGSGSQTANGVILRSLFTMGIPVSGKNLFPSNIQGLPTWFTIRANAAGFLARTDQSEILIAMNRGTVIEDLKGLAPGGVCLYADDLAFEKFRNDVHYYAIPATRLARESGAEASLRPYVANMAYVGGLAWLLGIELGEIEDALATHFRGKPKAVALNFGVVQAAHKHAAENLTKTDGFRVRAPAGRDRYDPGRWQHGGGPGCDLWRGFVRGVVSDHACLLVGGSVAGIPAAAPPRPSQRREPLPDRPVGG